jgi:exocyst complex protein 7
MAELAAAGPHIDRAVGPAAAVLKVFDAVHGLEPPLLLHHRGPGAVAGAAATVADLPGYLDGGLLAAALDMLEAEFRRLLADHSTPLSITTTTSASSTTRIPSPAVRKLSLILDRLLANGRQDTCIPLYIDARGAVVSASLRDLGLNYLRSPAEDAQALGPGVELWGRHLEFVARRLLESERQLCVKVFGKHKDDASACFAEVAAPRWTPSSSCVWRCSIL